MRERKSNALLGLPSFPACAIRSHLARLRSCRIRNRRGEGRAAMPPVRSLMADLSRRGFGRRPTRTSTMRHMAVARTPRDDCPDTIWTILVSTAPICRIAPRCLQRPYPIRGKSPAGLGPCRPYAFEIGSLIGVRWYMAAAKPPSGSVELSRDSSCGMLVLSKQETSCHESSQPHLPPRSPARPLVGLIHGRARDSCPRLAAPRAGRDPAGVIPSKTWLASALSSTSARESARSNKSGPRWWNCARVIQTSRTHKRWPG